ncbi:MAG TPA: hypothetical protein VFA77_06260 [Candidatus Eisenbacteria bacterium]|nr:hypothetical protein [Candidatus Eisenbacteria bacterium]
MIDCARAGILVATFWFRQLHNGIGRPGRKPKRRADILVRSDWRFTQSQGNFSAVACSPVAADKNVRAPLPSNL